MSEQNTLLKTLSGKYSQVLQPGWKTFSQLLDFEFIHSASDAGIIPEVLASTERDQDYVDMIDFDPGLAEAGNDYTLFEEKVCVTGQAWRAIRDSATAPLDDLDDYPKLPILYAAYVAGVKGKKIPWLDADGGVATAVDEAVEGLLHENSSQTYPHNWRPMRIECYLLGLQDRDKYGKLSDNMNASSLKSFVRSTIQNFIVSVPAIMQRDLVKMANTVYALLSIGQRIEGALPKKLQEVELQSLSVDEKWVELAKPNRLSYISTSITDHVAITAQYVTFDDLDLAAWDAFAQRMGTRFRIDTRALSGYRHSGFGVYTDGESEYHFLSGQLLIDLDGSGATTDAITLGFTISSLITHFKDLRHLEEDVQYLKKQDHYTWDAFIEYPVEYTDFYLLKSVQGYAENEIYPSLLRRCRDANTSDPKEDVSGLYHFDEVVDVVRTELVATDNFIPNLLDNANKLWALHLFIPSGQTPNQKLMIPGQYNMNHVILDVVQQLINFTEESNFQFNAYMKRTHYVEIIDARKPDEKDKGVMTSTNTEGQVRFEDLGNVLDEPNYDSIIAKYTIHLIDADYIPGIIYSPARTKGFLNKEPKYIEDYALWEKKRDILGMVANEIWGKGVKAAPVKEEKVASEKAVPPVVKDVAPPAENPKTPPSPPQPAPPPKEKVGKEPLIVKIDETLGSEDNKEGSIKEHEKKKKPTRKESETEPET